MIGKLAFYTTDYKSLIVNDYRAQDKECVNLINLPPDNSWKCYDCEDYEYCNLDYDKCTDKFCNTCGQRLLKNEQEGV